MPQLTSREAQILAAVPDAFERSWVIAKQAGLTGPKAAETAVTFLTALATKGFVERGGTRADVKWRRLPDASA
jgi:hypothetical protein